MNILDQFESNWQEKTHFQVTASCHECSADIFQEEKVLDRENWLATERYLDYLQNVKKLVVLQLLLMLNMH